MTDFSPLDIQYGHLGEPTYDHESRSWHFARKPVAEPRLKPLGKIKQVIEGLSSSEKGNTSDSSGYVFRSSKPTLGSKNLIPASDIIKETLNEAFPSSQYSRGDVHAYVNALSRTRLKRVEKVPVLATTAGHSGELVRLTLLSTKEIGRPHLKERTIIQPTTERGESCFWSGLGHAVLQISPSTGQDGELGRYLAIRYHDSVVILQPLLHSKPAAPQPPLSQSFFMPASRIAVRQILQLQRQEFLEGLILDVAFNPWNEMQVAVIDGKGNWTTWEICLSLRERDLWTANILSRGKVGKDDDPIPSTQKLDETWARLLWTSDHHTLMIAQRTVIRATHMLSGARSLRLESLVLGQSGDQVIDVRRSQDDPGIMFFLTTLKLIVVKLETVDTKPIPREIQLKATKMLSWIHERNPDDFSLSMAITQIAENKTHTTSIIMIYSRSNSHISVYTFELDRSAGQWLSSVDPYCLSLSSGISHNGETSTRLFHTLPILGVSLTPLSIGEPIIASRLDQAGEADPELVQQYRDLGIRLCQIRILQSDHSIWEGLLYSSISGKLVNLEEPKVVKGPKLTQAPLRLEHRFLEDDHVSQLRLGHHLDTRDPEDRAHAEPNVNDLKTLDLQWLVERLSGSEAVASTSTHSGNLAEMVNSTLAAFEGDHSSILKTLCEAVTIDPNCKDLKQIGKQVYTILQAYLAGNNVEDDSDLNLNMNNSVIVRQAVLSSFPQVITRTPDGLHDLCVHLRDFLPSYAVGDDQSHDPDHENLTGSVASQRYLASYTIGRRHVTDPKIAANNEESLLTALDINENPSSHRLRSFTDLEPQPILPRRLNQMLDRWTVDHDPDTVDWALATQQILSQGLDSEPEGSGSAQKKKAKRKRHFETSARSALTNEARFKDLGVGGSQPLPFREPGGPLPGSSSQVTATQDSETPMVLSQPERGLHGQRPMEKQKKKRKRKEGF